MSGKSLDTLGILVFLCVGCVLWKEKNKYFSNLRSAAIKDELTQRNQLKTTIA